MVYSSGAKKVMFCAAGSLLVSLTLQGCGDHQSMIASVCGSMFASTIQEMKDDLAAQAGSACTDAAGDSNIHGHSCASVLANVTAQVDAQAAELTQQCEDALNEHVGALANSTNASAAGVLAGAQPLQDAAQDFFNTHKAVLNNKKNEWSLAVSNAAQIAGDAAQSAADATNTAASTTAAVAAADADAGADDTAGNATRLFSVKSLVLERTGGGAAWGVGALTALVAASAILSIRRRQVARQFASGVDDSELVASETGFGVE